MLRCSVPKMQFDGCDSFGDFRGCTVAQYCVVDVDKSPCSNAHLRKIHVLNYHKC